MKKISISTKDKELIKYIYTNTSFTGKQIAIVMGIGTNTIFHILRRGCYKKKKFKKIVYVHKYDYIINEVINAGHDYAYFVKKFNLKVWKPTRTIKK